MFSRQGTALQLDASERKAYSKFLSELPVKNAPEDLLEHADTVAGKIATVLHNEFGAKKVWVFGSLASRSFSIISDIDIAYQGMAPELYFPAYVAVTNLAEGFNVDLVDINDCGSELRKEILSKGIVL